MVLRYNPITLNVKYSDMLVPLDCFCLFSLVNYYRWKLGLSTKALYLLPRVLFFQQVRRSVWPNEPFLHTANHICGTCADQYRVPRVGDRGMTTHVCTFAERA